MVKTINDDLRLLCHDLNVPIPAFFSDMDALFLDKFVYEHNLLGEDMIYDVSVRIDYSDLKTVCEYYRSHRIGLTDLYVPILEYLSKGKDKCFADVYFEYDAINYSTNLPGLLLTSWYCVQQLDLLSKKTDNPPPMSAFYETIDSQRNKQIYDEAIDLFQLREQKISNTYNDLFDYLNRKAVLYQVGMLPRSNNTLKLYYRFFPLQYIDKCIELEICKSLRKSWRQFESIVSHISMPIHAVIDFGVELTKQKDLPMLGISFALQDITTFFDCIDNAYPAQFSSEYWNHISSQWQTRGIISTNKGIVLQRRSVSHIKASLYPDRIDWKIYFDNSLFSPRRYKSFVLYH